MIDTAYYLAIFLIFLRLVTFFSIVDVFYPKGTPVILKISLAMIIALGLTSSMDYTRVLEISSNYMLVLAIVNEIAIGLILGFIVNLMFNIIQMAGGIMDTQVGLSMMEMLNPSTNTSSTMLGSLSYYIGSVIFFIIDGHHVLIKCLQESFNVISVGGHIAFENSFYVIVEAFSKIFIIGIRIALPIILIGIITDLTMALVSRTVPTINVMLLGMPVRIVVGLLSFTVFLPIMIKIIVYAFDMIPDILNDILRSLPAAPLVLVFADGGDDKTEEATPKKKNDARKKGQVARSKDVGLALTMLACTMVIILFSASIVSNLKEYMRVILQSGILEDVNNMSIKYICSNVIYKSLLGILPAAVPIMIAGIVGSIMQTGFMLTGETLKPSLSKLNPISGFKNMFSKKSLADLGKNIIVVSIVGFIGYRYVVDNYDAILQISNAYLPSLGEDIKKIISNLFVRICLVLIIIAAVDYFIQFRFHNKDMKMSKQEVKEEYKQMEGDPQIKGKIKQKQREMATRRMMSGVADATVVITNPTHLAIALKYDENAGSAPKVIAKGADLIALKIKELAKENDIPIMENKPLARMIFKQVEIDQEIPQDMYEAVAEVLAMVYKLKK